MRHVRDGTTAAYPNGYHVAEVEIDPDTGVIAVMKYSSVNDLGTVINPMIVEGQLHGGAVQGIGQALMEMTVYDSEGQFLTGSYMDYALPRASDVPAFTVAGHPVPAKTNPLGVKGCGEAGCAGALTSVMNAVADALSDYGIRHIDMPATPFRVWQAIQAVGATRAAPGSVNDDPGDRSSAIGDPRGRDEIRRDRLLRAFRQPLLHHAAGAAVPVRACRLWGDYTELGLAFTAFNVISTALQTPTGFLVDRMSARLLLVAGLLVGAAAFTIAALVDSFWVFVAMFALAGLGNTVYHPADYALLSRHIPAARTGRAFSFHTFAGMLGNAAAPPSLLFLQSLVGWRGAFLGAAVLGLVAALVMALAGEPPELAAAPGKTNARGGKPADTAALGAAAPAGAAPMGWRLLLTPAILLNLAFFIMLAMSSGALYNFLVPALGALHGTPVTVGNAALTGLLLLSPMGVLVGGWLAGRIPITAWSPPAA